MSQRNIINNLTLEYRNESVLNNSFSVTGITFFAFSRRSQLDFLLEQFPFFPILLLGSEKYRLWWFAYL